jgi:small membrane protein
MTPFQIVAISILAVLFLRELVEFRRDAVLFRVHWLRALIWLAAAVAIALPDWVQAVAESVGINRGADLVFYLFVLAFLGVTFYFYSRQVRTQRQITHLVRIMAVREAKRGGQQSRSVLP